MEQQTSYSAIIDDILANADLTTISAKAIRKGLQEKVDYDITPLEKELEMSFGDQRRAFPFPL